MQLLTRDQLQAGAGNAAGVQRADDAVLERQGEERRRGVLFNMRPINVVIVLIVLLAVSRGGSAEPASVNCLDEARGSQETCRESTYSAYGDTRLARLIEEAIENNPSVREALARQQAAARRIPQVAALPDPVLTVTQHARSPETRVGPQTTLLSVTQSFPGFGERGLRRESTSRASAVRVAELEARRAEVVRRLKLSYYELGYVDRALQINREETELLAHHETLARARYIQGFGRQGDVLRLQAEVTRSLIAREELRSRRVDAAAVLNAALDRPTGAAVAPVVLANRPAVRLEDVALAPARAVQPDVLASRRRRERQEADLELAQRSQWPDFWVGVAWGSVLERRDQAGRTMPPTSNGKDVYSVTLGVNVPLFRAKYDAGVREAAARAEAARAAYRATVNETRRAIRAATFRLGAIQRQIDLLDRTLLPQVEQALLSAEAAYATGEADVLDLLDGGRMLLDVRSRLARLHADYFETLADLERATGFAIAEENP